MLAVPYTEWRRWLEAIAAGAGGDWDVPAVMRELETPRVLDSKPSGARLWRVARALGIDKRRRLEWAGSNDANTDVWKWHAEIDACRWAMVWSFGQNGAVVTAEVRCGTDVHGSPLPEDRWMRVHNSARVLLDGHALAAVESRFPGYIAIDIALTSFPTREEAIECLERLLGRED